MSHHYAIFSARYAPLTGGVESYTRNIAHELAAQGNRVTVVTSRLDDSATCETQDDGVEVVRLPSHALMGARLPVSRRTREYRELLGSFDGKGIDRVLVNTRFYRHSVEGLRFAQRVGASAVVLDHGSAYLVLGNALADLALRVYEHGMTALGKRFAPRYAGVSRMSVEWLRTFGIQARAVIPNAIDAPAFRECASSRGFRAELGIDEDTTLVTFVGRLTPEKGALQLANAMAELGDAFACVMAGDGFLRGEIESLSLSNLHLAGLLDHSDLSALLSQGDLFCLPTRSEGFCTSLLEAGAWGLAPLMPRVGGVDEVMGSPVEFGRLLQSNEPAHVAQSIREMAAQGQTGHLDEFRSFVEESCSWQASVAALERAFES